MTDMEQHFRDAHQTRPATASILLEYAVVLALILLVGAVALAEVSGAMDSFVHSITFAV
jgi:hypothetical protein